MPKQPKKDNHFAAMPYEEVPEFLKYLRTKENVSRLALEFLILTATRSGEVRGATMDEIDSCNHLWTIPAERMKMGKAHTIPLTASALDVLERVRQQQFRMHDTGFVRKIVIAVEPLILQTLRRPIGSGRQCARSIGARNDFGREVIDSHKDYPFTLSKRRRHDV